MWIEDGTKEQQEHDAKDDIGKHVEVTIVEQQDDKAQHDGGAYPDDLHARARLETEEIGIAIVIARTTHTHPSEDEQGDVDGDCPPVERADDTLGITCLLYHN